MEKMRVVLITLFLFIGAAVAEDAGIGKAVNPAKDVIAEEAGIGDAITPEEGKATNIQAYESPRFKKFVTHCSSHVTQTCSGNDPLYEASGINSLSVLSFCLFDSMEKCLADHGASLKDFQDNNNLGSMSSSLSGSIQNQLLLIETVTFRAVLKTCSHVSAQYCFNHPNVATSALAACLMPYLDQCVYPFSGTPTPPPPPPPPPPPLFV